MSTGQLTNAVGAPPRRPDIEALRVALGRMSAAERRLRTRDHRRPGDLTYAQIRSLAALHHEGEMTAGQLAKAAELNPASVTAMLDHLEEAGVLRRTRSESDRRVYNVSLTDAGRELVARKQSAWQAKWEAKLDAVSERDLHAAAQVIEQITELYVEISARLDDEDGSPAS